jgi:quercetin 2,3-dioxygenase
MEIVTIVLERLLKHRNSTGGHGVLKAGEVQHMSAGSGIVHSEYNASKTEPVSLLQIWVKPRVSGIAPNYEQKGFRMTRNSLTRIVDADGVDGALPIAQDVTFFLGEFYEDENIALNDERMSYVFMISG